MDFTYEARELATGEQIHGEVSANSREDAVAAIKAQNLIVQKIDEKKEPWKLENYFTFMNKVKPDELAVFSRQFQTMIAAGMPIVRVIAVLEEQTDNDYFKEILKAVRTDVDNGSSLSNAFSKHPKIFTSLYVNIVEVGEVTGSLETALERIADYLEKDYILKKEIKSATRYPMVVLGFGMLMMMGLTALVLPRFTGIFHELSPTAELPLLTAILQSIGLFISHKFFIFIPLCIGFYVGFKKVFALPEVHNRWDKIKLRLPMKIGYLVNLVIFARVSRTMVTMVATGVPLMQTLEIVGKTSNNYVVEQEFERLRERIQQGASLSEPIKESEIFPKIFSNMVAAGEEAGNMEGMLEKVAVFYEAEVDGALKSLKSIIEPLLIMLVGAMVGTIVIAMYLPLFKMYTLIK